MVKFSIHFNRRVFVMLSLRKHGVIGMNRLLAENEEPHFKISSAAVVAGDFRVIWFRDCNLLLIMANRTKNNQTP